MAWRKQAEKWAIKALKTPLSAFENNYNQQVLQGKKRNRIEEKNPLKQGLKPTVCEHITLLS